MISTENIEDLPSIKILKSICKAISTLDAIYSPDWEYRYYSYNCQWNENEEFFQMRDGQGNELLILFQEQACVLNGFAIDFKNPDLSLLTKAMPKQFNEFIFGEPVHSIGTTFCAWNTENKWQTGDIGYICLDNSVDLLNIFDNHPQTYIDWAIDYYDNIETIPYKVVEDIYNGQPLTKEMVLALCPDFECWEQLKKDLKEIDYPTEM